MGWLNRRAAAPAAAAAPHGAAAAADPYAFQAAHRRLAWMLRLSAATNIVLAAAVTVTVGTISALLPLRTTEIALVRTHAADDRIYRIEPLDARTEGYALLLETMARRYVQLVLTINPVDQAERYREASRMTEAVLARRLREERIETREMQAALSSGLTRSILVESAAGIESFGPDRKFVVDFAQVDSRGGQEVSRRRLRAYLSMTTRPQEVPAGERYHNPLGVLVTGFVLQDRGEI